MKTSLTVLFAALALSANAFAGHEGPQAAPAAPTPVIAEYAMMGGFMPPTMPITVRVQVHADGQVTRFRGYRNGISGTDLVATLGPKQLERIRKDVLAAKAGALVDPNPSSPACMDAPMVLFKAFPNGGDGIELAETAGCKEFQKANASTEESEVVSSLNALVTLANLDHLYGN